MAKKWPEIVVQRSFIKEHLFPFRLYKQTLSCCDLELPKLMSLYGEATLSEITKHAAGISKECACLLLIKLDHQFT